MRKLVTSLIGLLIMLSSLQSAEMTNSKSGKFIKGSRLSYAAEKVKNMNRTDVITEGFEGTVVPPDGWSITDADGDGNCWQYEPEFAFHGGAKAITSESFRNMLGPLTPDNYLITPAIAIPPAGGSGNVNYWVCAQDAAWAGEHYAVVISTTGTAPADFSTTLFEETLTAKDGKPAGAWYERNVSIPASYASQTVYLAFRHFNCTDKYAMNLDDVKISTISGGGPDITAPTIFNLSGLTTQPGQPLNISVTMTDETGIASVIGHYQIAGQAGWTDFSMTASKNINGTYTGTIPDQANPITGKVKFTTTDTVIPSNTGTTPESNISWVMPGITGEGESFETVAFPPLGWTAENIDGAGKEWAKFTGTPTVPTHSGTKTAFHTFGSIGYAETGLLITPALAINASAPETSLKFWESDRWASEYQHHSIMVSTTNNQPSSFVELAVIPAASEAPAWSEKNIDLSAYKGQTIYLAFKYSGTYADGWYIDDVQTIGATVVIPPDPNPPTAATPTGTSAETGTNMTIKTTVSDATGIQSVVGHYKLAGQTTWTDVTMTADKTVTGTYTGTIPAQSTPVTGKIKFTTTDTTTPANTGDSPEFDIAWSYSKWMEWGSIYDTGSGIGIATSPWWAGADFDFGPANPSTEYRLTKVKLGVSSATDASWKVRAVTQTSSTTLNLGDVITTGTINCAGVSELVPTIADAPDTTKILTGHIAIVFDMPMASYITRDEQATSDHTYVNLVDDGTLATLTSQASQMTGAFLIGIYVSKGTVGINDVQMLPGKSELSQNYPNPFNPVTTISFYNNMTGNVKLTVLNAKGETVTTLVNNEVAAGNHKVNFNAERYNSGVYFYKLETPTATITKKMLLVK